MAEQLIADKFVSLYYNNLAYNPYLLGNLYSLNSTVKYHDMGEVIDVLFNQFIGPY